MASASRRSAFDDLSDDLMGRIYIWLRHLNRATDADLSLFLREKLIVGVAVAFKDPDF